MTYDAVLSYHTTTFACGVAKFSAQLAGHLGVPFKGYGQPASYPLISVKFAELDRYTPDPSAWYDQYDLFLHDAPTSPRARVWVRNAQRVWTGNETITEVVRELKPDAVTAWCPSTLTGDPTASDDLNVLLFGMGHKVQPERLRQLKRVLDASERDYVIHVSTAVHEGHPWDESFRVLTEMVRDIFGGKVRMLGYLADDGLARALSVADVVALFFEPAARANNTTLWSAMSYACTVITNLDEHSPVELQHGVTVLDIARPIDLKHPTTMDSATLLVDAMTAARGRDWEHLMALWAGVPA